LRCLKDMAYHMRLGPYWPHGTTAGIYNLLTF